MVNMLIIEGPKAPLQATGVVLPAAGPEWSPALPIHVSPLKHKQQASLAVSFVLVLVFLALSIGVVVFTTAGENMRNKDRQREPARNIPMVHLR